MKKKAIEEISDLLEYREKRADFEEMMVSKYSESLKSFGKNLRTVTRCGNSTDSSVTHYWVVVNIIEKLREKLFSEDEIVKIFEVISEMGGE